MQVQCNLSLSLSPLPPSPPLQEAEEEPAAKDEL